MDNQNQPNYPNQCFPQYNQSQQGYQQQQQPIYPQQGYQQYGYQAQPTMPKPNNNLVWAILSTVCCCLPFGIASIVYASKVDGLYQAGDYVGAQKAADNASKYAIISAILGVICIIIEIIYYAAKYS